MELPSPDTIQIALTVGSLAVAWLSVTKVALPFWHWCKRTSSKVGGALDTLGGREPIIERATGKELSPAVPPLGMVLAEMKAELARVGDVGERIDRVDARLDRQEARLDGLEQTTGALIAEKFENGAHAALSAVEKQNNDAIDGEVAE